MARPVRRSLGTAALALGLILAGCSHQSGSRRAFCAQVAKVPPLSGVLAGYDRADPAELTRRLATTRTAYDDLRKTAPSAIKGDTDAMVDLVDAIIDAVGAHPSDPAAVQAAIRSTTSKHTAAGPGAANVATYARDRCGVELDPTAVTTTTTTTTTVTTTTSAVTTTTTAG